MKFKRNQTIFGNFLLICTLVAACQPDPKPTQSPDGIYTVPDTPKEEIATVPPDTIATEVQFFPPMTQPAQSSNCSDSFSSRLSIGMNARVAFTNGFDMRVRGGPGLEQEILAAVPEGTEFSVVGSSRCEDDLTWWPILTDNGIEGWMAEYQGNVYLLEPLP